MAMVLPKNNLRPARSVNLVAAQMRAEKLSIGSLAIFALFLFGSNFARASVAWQGALYDPHFMQGGEVLVFRDDRLFLH
jgi:hypothetical protein